MTDSAVVDAALRKSGLISNGCSGLIIYLCGLRQIRPYIKWKRIIKKLKVLFKFKILFKLIFMDMMNKILELVVFSQDLLVTQYEKP
jgi:hypothetical protein